VIIGIITLLGSVIGLMNIMLVSVAERTREIGVSKALGAKSSTVKRQFLTESVMISLMGGAAGVILGMLVGNIFGMIFHTGFIVPWLWIVVGVTLCAIVGIISGIYPAIKASKLDPIVALRYE
jgi:putative ABC transport system permease protein